MWTLWVASKREWMLMLTKWPLIQGSTLSSPSDSWEMHQSPPHVFKAGGRWDWTVEWMDSWLSSYLAGTHCIVNQNLGHFQTFFQLSGSFFPPLRPLGPNFTVAQVCWGASAHFLFTSVDDAMNESRCLLTASLWRRSSEQRRSDRRRRVKNGERAPWKCCGPFRLSRRRTHLA